MNEDTQQDINIALMQTDIQYIKKTLDELKDNLKESYVQRNEFDPIKRVVYGMVALVLTGVGGAIIGLVLTVR